MLSELSLGNSVSRVYLQYYPGVETDFKFQNHLIIWSIYHKDFLNWLELEISENVKRISIILPTDIVKCEAFLEKLKKIDYIKNQEVWFDREISLITYAKIRDYFPNANIIVGKSIHSSNNCAQIYDKLYAFKTI